MQLLDIADVIAQLGWEKSDQRFARLELFIDAVQKAPIALVSHRDKDRLISRHLVPSLGALSFLPNQGRVLDMGSGGGFPAIPLAIARSDLEFVLVDSTKKKVNFLADCIRELDILNARAVWKRLETLNSEASFTQAFQAVTARAVAKLPELLPLAKVFLEVSGRALLWKGRNWRREGELKQYGFVLDREIELGDGSVLLLLLLQEEGISANNGKGRDRA